MLALPPQILFGLGDEGGEPIFSSGSWPRVPMDSPRLLFKHTRCRRRMRGVTLARPRNMKLEWLVPLLFLPTFIAMWTGIVFLIGATGGWRTLGKKYAAGGGGFTRTRGDMQSG